MSTLVILLCIIYSKFDYFCQLKGNLSLYIICHHLLFATLCNAFMTKLEREEKGVKIV